MLQGQRDLLTVAQLLLSELAPLVGAQHGTFYINDAARRASAVLKLLASYAYNERKSLADAVPIRARAWSASARCEKERILLTDVPNDYIKISSGLGEATPLNIVVLPVLFEGEVKAVIELASFNQLQRDPPRVPRSAHGEHRHRAEHDRGHHAYGGTAEAIARRSPKLQSQQQELTKATSGSRAGRTLQNRKNCSQQQEELQRPTELQEKRSCWPSRRRKSNARTAKSSRPSRRWKKRPNSSR